MVNKLPDDLIGCDILTRLPVKSLLRFRCVSKTWCALIDNNSFVKQHLNHSILTKTKHTLILYSNSNSHSIGLYSLTDDPLELVQPIKSSPTILGSCNGLLCLSYGINRSLVLLWNPATRKHIKIPIARSHYNRLSKYGFGYDSVSDDYKFVEVDQFFIDEHSSFTLTNVYSLRSNSWRMVHDFGYFLIMPVPSAFACGAIHWLGCDNFDTSSQLSYAFDLATEKYRTVTLPKHPVIVSELGGCLSVVCGHIKVGVSDVWVMKYYGVSESWTKLLTLSNFEIVRTIGGVVPLAYSESGDEVLLVLESTQLLWYNLETRTSKVVDINGFSRFSHLMISLESLVSLGEKAENDEKQGEESE